MSSGSRSNILAWRPLNRELTSSGRVVRQGPPGKRPYPALAGRRLACGHVATIHFVVADQCKRPVSAKYSVLPGNSGRRFRVRRRRPLVLAVRQLGTVAFARMLDLIRDDGASKRAVMTMFRSGTWLCPRTRAARD